jgi:chitodextrinase
MKTKIPSLNLVRVLVIVALVISLALGAISPAKASITYTVIGWGKNNSGEATIPANLTDVVVIAAGGAHSLALKGDGTVVAWGWNGYGQTDVPSGLTGVGAISAGREHSLALKSDGTVVGWGSNIYGQTSIPSDLANVVAISAGEYHSLALESDGTVTGWGGNNYGQIRIPYGLTNVVAIAAGFRHSLALKGDGTVVAWGDNGFGEITIPNGLTNVIAIAAGAHYSLALKSDGTVVGWGYQGMGLAPIPSDATDVVAIAAGLYHNLVLKRDGTVVAWGFASGYGENTTPPGLTGVVAIAAGHQFNLVLVPAEVPSNTAPVANPGGPYLGAVNTTISFDGSLSSDPEGDPLTYAWGFGDGGTATGAMPTHTFTASGLYNVCLTVNDGSLDSDPACTLAVVYDPSAGFVTGGGWIDTPVGAYKPDESLAGKATFGFMSKYQKGASVPTGNTAFQFDLAGMSFASQSYEWLVVNQGGTNAQFKGSGLINGAADPNGNAYKFMLWASDGSPDTFRIRIWWEDADGEHDVYDNDVAQAIGAGNIVVHAGK